MEENKSNKQIEFIMPKIIEEFMENFKGTENTGEQRPDNFFEYSCLRVDKVIKNEQ